ncbi:MAG: hypothetical protein DRI86_06315, partial [Bacteroidetes bacterium]
MELSNDEYFKEKIVADYQKLIEKYTLEKEEVGKKKFYVSIVRFILFIGIVFSLWLAVFKEYELLWFVFLGLLSFFLFLIKYHSKLFNKHGFLKRLIRINEEELLALNDDFSAFENGIEFKPTTHDFSQDLDVLGESSLYNKINRTSTLFGSKRLSSWLLNPLINSEVINSRQEAVSELADMTNFCQEFRANGLAFEEKEEEYDFVRTWKEQNSLFIQNSLFKVLIYVIPVVNLIALALFSFDFISGKLLSLLLALALLIVGFYTKRINQIHKNLSKRTKWLEKYVDLLKLVENQKFSSKLLKELQKGLETKHNKAYQRIQDLSKILSALDSRLNVFVGILLNAFFIWDIRQILRMEVWKRDNIDGLDIWFDIIATIDSLNSIAVLSHNNPIWIFPKVSLDKKWQFKKMHHPLMKSNTSVPNDFYVDRVPFLNVITGANMAGKSTYLRTIGSNLLLAMIGAPVHATVFEFYPIQIVSSLRTTDSLMKNESYFYAEIKRLQMIVHRLRAGEELFVLLDEILKGTNSHDKEEGSKLLLKQLVKLDAVGIIATHDLSLGNLSQDYIGIIQNQCFEVDIIDDQLSFDYKLRKGVAQNMNASF